MSASIRPCRQRATSKRGFALVVTMSMLILLMVLAVGLLSLSSISLRSSGQAEASARARANARMALVLAIGELQKHAGSDTRVTARADILDESHPPVLGVWKSWEGTNHETSGPFAGRPVSPGNYTTAKRTRFLAWLTSVETITDPPSTTKGTGTVTLLGENSVGSRGGRDSLQIHLEPTPIDQGARSGSLAWWIGGENQKARLPDIEEPPDDTSARWSVHSQSHATADPEPFGLEALFDRPELANIAVSLRQSDLIDPENSGLRGSQEFFHDLSTTSVGLLTNTATGGWRKDLSLATENWHQIGTGNLPFFRLSPSQNTAATKTATRSILYPWSSYRNGNIPIYQHGAVASWENLKDYITFYKEIQSNASGRSVLSPKRNITTSVAIDGDVFGFLHKVRTIPVVARVQWVYSHSAASVGGTTPGLQPRLLLNPVVTLWNPYNVELTLFPLTLRFPKPLPTALRYTVNGTRDPNYRSLTTGSTNYSAALSNSGSLQYTIGSGTLGPGETRVYSHRAAAQPADGGTSLTLTPGFSPTGGHYFTIRNSAGQPAVVPGNASLSVEVALDTAYNDIAVGVGVYLDLLKGTDNNRRHLAYRMVYPPQLAREVYPPIEDLGSITSGELGSTIGNPRPFLTTIFGARMASNTHLSAKGFVPGHLV